MATEPTFDTPLTLTPCSKHYEKTVPDPHSDQGVQYLSNTYISTLTDHGIEISLAHRGRPWGKRLCGKVYPNSQGGEIYLNDYDDFENAKTCIGHFIEHVYNQTALTRHWVI